MYETEDHKGIKHERKRQIIKKKLKKEIEQIEKWSGTTFKELIFHSNFQTWERGKSEFDDIVFNKEKLVFLIEEKEGNVFGGTLMQK